jgi:nucleotide-binding universal stress UspA family protein
MTKVLVPVDGSEFSERALDYAIELAKREESIDIHLLSVQIPIDSGHAHVRLRRRDPRLSPRRGHGRTEALH